MADIQVLLSVFNGQRFLGELLASLEAQTASGVTVLARDDGSTDAGRDLLERFGATVIEGPNLGVTKSFLTLVEASDPNARFFAFCDQDDVWLPDKLEVAAKQLDAIDAAVPALYFANYTATDAGLQPLYDGPRLARSPSFANSLVQNVATGATTVLNRAARDLLTGAHPTRLDDITISHDAWAYQVVSGCGQVIYDPQPQILYRQHESQTIGLARGWAHWSDRLRRYADLSLDPWLRQAAALRSAHGDDLTAPNRELLDRFLDAGASVGSRLGYLVSGEVYRQSRLESVMFRALRALNRRPAETS